LRQKRLADCSAIERFVKNTVWCSRSDILGRAHWLPHEQTWIIQGKTHENSVYQSLEAQIKQLVDMQIKQQGQMRSMQEAHDEENTKNEKRGKTIIDHLQALREKD
jgi:hypothetical protein